MARVRLKVCGVMDEASALAAAAAGVDAIGFRFEAGHPREVDPELAFAIARLLPPFVATVGVFRDIEDVDAFAEVEQVCPTTMTQFDGEEDEDLVAGCGPEIIKTLRVDADRPELVLREMMRWAAMDEVAALRLQLPERWVAVGQERAWADRVGAVVSLAGSVTKPVIVGIGLTEPTTIAERLGVLARHAGLYAVDVGLSESVRFGEALHAVAEIVRALRNTDA